MKKKVISAILVAAMMTGCLTACGADGGAKGKQTVSIFVFGNDQEQAIYTDMFKAFEEANNCTVEAQMCIKDDYNTTLTGMMTAKDLPDVFYMGPEAVSQYVANGYAMEITPVLEIGRAHV